MANQFKLGTLAIGGTPVTLPYGKSCLFDGRIPELRNTEPGKEISWVVVGGKLIASNCLLSSISYHDLDVLGLVGPTRAYIDGRAYTLRLLRVGAEEGAPNEWDSALDAVGENDAVWAWSSRFFWGMDEVARGSAGVVYRAVRENNSPRCWDKASESAMYNFGWRPVLEPVSVELSSERIDCQVAVWHGQQIIYGVVESYNSYDVCLHCARKLFEKGYERSRWYIQSDDGKFVVDRKQLAAVQLR